MNPIQTCNRKLPVSWMITVGCFVPSVVCAPAANVAPPGPEVLQQHDANRATPIQLAQRRGHLELAAQLELLLRQARGLTNTNTSSSNSNIGNNSSSLAADAPAEAGDRVLPSTPADPAQESGAQELQQGVGNVDGRAEGLVIGAAGAGRDFGRTFGRGRGREALGVAKHDNALPEGTTSAAAAAVQAAAAVEAAAAASTQATSARAGSRSETASHQMM